MKPGSELHPSRELHNSIRQDSSLTQATHKSSNDPTKVFRGELAPLDPRDEPASKLRIRATRVLKEMP